MASDVFGLGLESSCDETSASVVRNGREVLSNIISSQIDIHSEYFGVVPEIASRAHLEIINGVTAQALDAAGIGFNDLAYVSVTNRPGLVGSLMISLQSAKAIAYLTGIPLVTVSHLEAHLYAAFLGQSAPSFPFTALLVSGGNTSLYLVEDIGVITLLGLSTDDAVGEAYDKVSKVLGLGYPGGPVIDRLARSAATRETIFPMRIVTKSDPLNFSYSGLKTAVINHIRNHPDHDISATAWAFQESAVELLMSRLMAACDMTGTRDVVVAGGVAANSRLRERLKEYAAESGRTVFIPEPVLCTDNAAMVAGLGFQYYERKKFAGLDTEVSPRDSELRIKRKPV